MKKTDTYFKVILPINIDPLTYKASIEDNSVNLIGKYVLVSLKNKKKYVGLIIELNQSNDIDHSKVRAIDAFVDKGLTVRHEQILFWKWLSSYYMSTLGQLIKWILPIFSTISTKTIYALNKSNTANQNSSFLEQITPILVKEHVTLKSLAKRLKLKESFVKNQVKRELKKGTILSEDIFINRHSEKLINGLTLSKEFNENAKTKKQNDLLEFIKQNKDHTGFISNRKIIAHQYSQTLIHALIKQKIVKKETRTDFRVSVSEKSHDSLNDLTDQQTECLEQITNTWSQSNLPVFLHGVTGSGKTEVYLHLMDRFLKENTQNQILFLVPEIALSTQMVKRVGGYFSGVAVFHSKLSIQQRIDFYRRMQIKNDIRIVLGTRSALFLPYNKLGLIIVDESHDLSYKHRGNGLKYHARDAAIMLSKFHKASILMGSATPSLQSVFNHNKNKYHWVTLKQKFNKTPHPKVELIDLKQTIKKKQMASTLLSNDLYQAIKHTLAAQKKVILFQNRRGFSTSVHCHICDYVFSCIHCDVRLTYHKDKEQLVCHYCNYAISNPKKCKKCNQNDLMLVGLGTQKIENEITEKFLNAVCERLDLDATNTKTSHQKILNDFSDNKIQILVGTQMVTKGLDFKNVGLIGVVQTDHLLSFPSFSTNERAFQLLVQVAGRAARKKGETARVIFQSYQSDHPVLKWVKNNDYITMTHQELEERKIYEFPPYTKLIEITLSHPKEQDLELAAQTLQESLLVKLSPKQILGPSYKRIAKIKNIYYMHLILKISRKNYISDKEYLRQMVTSFIKNYKTKVKLTIDVDPIF